MVAELNHSRLICYFGQGNGRFSLCRSNLIGPALRPKRRLKAKKIIRTSKPTTSIAGTKIFPANYGAHRVDPAFGPARIARGASPTLDNGFRDCDRLWIDLGVSGAEIRRPDLLVRAQRKQDHAIPARFDQRHALASN